MESVYIEIAKFHFSKFVFTKFNSFSSHCLAYFQINFIFIKNSRKFRLLPGFVPQVLFLSISIQFVETIWQLQKLENWEKNSQSNFKNNIFTLAHTNPAVKIVRRTNVI